MSVIKNIGWFLPAAILSRALGWGQSFVLAKALGPENFGIWVTLVLLVSYSCIFSLGTLETLNKQVPFFLGRNDHRRVREIESSVLGSLVLSASLLGLVALLTPLVLPLTSFHVGIGLMLMVLATMGILYFSAYFYYRFSAYENFKMFGAMDVIRSAFAVAFVAGGGWLWGLLGAVTGYLLHEIAMLAVMARLSIRDYGWPGISFRWESILAAIRVGLPITLLWWVLTLTASVDRMVLGRMLGAAAVGYYALGISLANALAIVPMVVGRVLYPKVNKHFGGNADTETMKRVVLAPTLALGTLLVNCQICLLVGTPLLYNQLLPKYHPGMLAGQILIVGSFFYCLFRNGANYLIAANQEGVFLKYIVSTLVFNLVCDISLVKAGFGLEGVAVGTSLAGFYLTTLVWRRVLNGLGFQSRELWATIFRLYLPAILLVLAFGGLRLFLPAAFQVFNSLSVAIGVLLLVSLNAALWCFPKYRAEMLTWRSIIQRKRQFVQVPTTVGDAV